MYTETWLRKSLLSTVSFQLLNIISLKEAKELQMVKWNTVIGADPPWKIYNSHIRVS
jgi:hypothetical protein